MHWCIQVFSIVCIYLAGCQTLRVIDGCWKLCFPHCMMAVSIEVEGLPLVNFPNVCTAEPAPGEVFCQEHLQIIQAKGIPTQKKDFLKHLGCVGEFVCFKSYAWYPANYIFKSQPKCIYPGMIAISGLQRILYSHSCPCKKQINKERKCGGGATVVLHDIHHLMNDLKKKKFSCT